MGLRAGTIEHLNVCDGKGNVTGTAPYLGYGDIHFPLGKCSGPFDGPPGIKLRATGGSEGKYVFVQILNSDSRTYTHTDGTSYTCGPTEGLDGAYPFPGVDPALPAISYDGPQMPLPNSYTTGTRSFLATMYLLWQPEQLKSTATPSIPVPIGRQQWQFGAKTYQEPPINSGRWQKPITTGHGDVGAFVTAQAGDPSYGYPQWDNVADPNNCNN